ncbi:Npt1/Npt2 family nucleotide transporter [Candidatus Finniella inopinata]|uniref:ADP,ATP carrier protein n=1 Tax=Candidatus Finniella inopinata TaxID=1696036 RepID=A0A4Q7DJM4_9PROT|nr:Npt1/Npt2 family nucleotide transporter [Candidatus Finniella inopinata]RZI46459.1 NTP/NDP exchange transporter [Candidatus Finniella inopinata]
MSASETTKPAKEFTGLRGIFFPIYNYEIKKFLPMGIMMMCILFVYNIVRDTKDTLVVNAPGGGAECLSFLKLYGVTPSAILFMVLFVKLANIMERERLFYTILTPFLIFFGAFAFLIYPYTDVLHMSLETIQRLQVAYPTFHWMIPVIGNWSFGVFYILSELWGSVILSMLFWQFANEITKIHEAKRFYGLFGMIGNVGLLIAGPTIILCAKYAKSLQESMDGALDKQVMENIIFGFNLKCLMGSVIVAGAIIAITYRWMNKNVLTDPRLYQPGEGAGKKKKPKMSIGESFKYILSNRYLGLIAVLVLAYGVAINLVEGVWKGQIKIAFPDKNDYNAFMGQFTAWTGLITILLMVVGNNILRRLSWKSAAVITPIMVLVTSVIFFYVVWDGTKSSPMSPLLGTTVVMVAVIVGQIQNVLSKGTKYSLFDSTKQMAYIPLDPEAKVKGQAAVEVIGGRAGKSGGAFIQSTMLAVIGGSVSLASLSYILGPIVIVICLIWVMSVFGLNKKFLALTEGKSSSEAG